MNEKQFARYLRAVRRRLTLPKKMKDRVMDNLRCRATRSARVHCASSASAQRCLLCWLGF